jgi:hypothetical protein
VQNRVKSNHISSSLFLLKRFHISRVYSSRVRGGNWDDLNHFAFRRVQYVQYTATDWSEPTPPDPVHTRFPRHVYFYFHFLSISFSSAEWWED